MDHSVPTRRELIGVSLLAASTLAAPAFVSGAASAAGEKESNEVESLRRLFREL
jgi:hypothetical protein